MWRYASSTPSRTAADESFAAFASASSGRIFDERIRGGVAHIRILVVVGAQQREQRCRGRFVAELAETLRGEELHARLGVAELLHERVLRLGVLEVAQALGGLRADFGVLVVEQPDEQRVEGRRWCVRTG